MGSIFMKALNRMKKKVLIVDFNPEAITELENQKISHVYGDMANLEFLKKLNFKKARVIISSVQKEQDNLVLLKHLKKIKCKAITFVTANHLYEALNFYDLGADYVILPHLMSGESVSLILEKYLKDKKALNKIKKDHLKHLLEINNETRK
jgi:Trk K+ transport system NAD-binding subunit